MTVEIGTAKYGKGKQNFKIKDGPNIYGILPPLFGLASKGRWSIYYRIEWGYQDNNGKNRPFQDVRVVNRKTKMVEVESDAYLRREQLKADLENLKVLYRQGQATKEQLQEQVELVKRYNLECKHYLNVITPDGKIGLLKIGHRCKIAIDGALDTLRQKGVDPIGLQGVFLNINRYIPKNAAGKDMPLDTIYTVTPYMENVQATVGGQAQIVQQRKFYTIDDTIKNRLEAEAFELDKLYPTVTSEEVTRMVNEGIPAIEEILGKTESQNIDITQNATPTKVDTVPATQPTPEVQENTTPTPTPQTHQQTPTPSMQQQPAQSTTTETPNVANQSDEEFLREIGAL